MMGIPRNHTTPYKKLDECHECGEEIKKGDSIQYLKVFDEPWATKACHVVLHDDNDEDGHGSCIEKLFDTSWADFRFFECESCHRIIVRQCLDNGWRSYVKERDDEEICVKCYQEEILENGFPETDLENGKLPGDFFNHSELSAFEWSLVPGMGDKFINGKASASSVTEMALTMIKKGYKVLINYDSMGIGGSEGYVSLYCKEGGE